MSTKILPTINRRPIMCKADNLYSHNCTVSNPMNAKHQPALSGTYVRPSPCYSCSGDMSNIVDAFIVATRFTNRAEELRAAPNPRPRPAQLHASTVNNTGRFQVVTVMTMHHILVRVHPPPCHPSNQNFPHRLPAQHRHRANPPRIPPTLNTSGSPWLRYDIMRSVEEWRS